MDSIDVEKYNYYASIRMIADAPIDIYQHTPLIRLMYERKIQCETYLDDSNLSDKDHCLCLIKFYNNRIKQLLMIY